MGEVESAKSVADKFPPLEKEGGKEGGKEGALMTPPSDQWG